MRILHVIGSLAPRYGGPSTAAPAMCGALAARGHHVEIATTDMDGSGALSVPVDQAATTAGVPVTYRPVHWPRSYAASLGLGCWLRRYVEEFDVLHIHSLYQFHTWYAARCCRRAGVPYILRPHGALNPYHLREHRLRKAVYMSLVEGRALRAAAGMQYTSTAEHEHAVRHHGQLPTGFVVPLGVDPVPPGQFDELLHRHPELAGRTLVTFLGRLTAKKRLDLLVDAFAVVAAADQRAHLVVAGPDDGVGQSLRARVDTLGLGGRVSMLGLLTGDPKAALLRHSRVVALPSEDESFGVAVAEAMSAGTAVVVTEGVAIHQEIEAAGAGLVVPLAVGPLAKAVRTLAGDERLAAGMGRNGQALARSRWTWEQVAADLERMYEDAIARRRGDPGRPAAVPPGDTGPDERMRQMTAQMETLPTTAVTPGKLPVTVVIFTLDEEKNLPDALASVQWADAVVVVDSHSTDRTADIAVAAGAKVVQFDYRGQGPKKMEWSLRNLPFEHEWVFLLDADERVTPQLRAEIAEAVERGSADGYCVDREFHFMGREVRCFRPNWNLRLFRHRLGRFEDLGLNDLPGTGDIEVHEHVVLDGRMGFLDTPLLHDDDRGLTPWLTRHNKYATWEAHLYRKFRQEPVGVGPLGFLRLDALRRKRVLRRVWVRLPGRPLLRFLIWYVGRRGFLDGRQGFFFCVLMAYYELTISAKLFELESSGQAGA